MTPEAQRIAIAEACGWHCDNCDEPPSVCQGCIWTEDSSRRIPDYLNDLNACHEMEKVLRDAYNPAKSSPQDWVIFCLNLGEIEEEPIHATAAQKAEAFLKCLGKWTT